MTVSGRLVLVRKWHADENVLKYLKLAAIFLKIFYHRSRKQMQVSVRDNNVDQALRVLKKKLQREGVYREMRLKEFFEKPSIRKAREKKEAISRQRKLERKKAQREG